MPASLRRAAPLALAALVSTTACASRGASPASPAPARAAREAAAPPAGTRTSAAITEGDLRARLFAFAHDSMMGRAAGSPWNAKGAEYIASEFRRVGLTPAGDSGTFFQSFTLRRSGATTRNVIAVLPGSDPTLRGEYVAITAHNDHVGFTQRPVDHDSVRAFNRVVRPAGADDRNRPATEEEMPRIRAILDSLRRLRPARLDSVFNGADDDGSGTVALLEIAEALAAGGARPKRSILFVSHGAEEVGLVGSAWFTDHPTVPREAIVAEIDVDMIGRGGATDLPKGGPGYMEVVGSRRLSTEFGDLLEAVNARQPMPFTFNYEYDVPGHPLQYYCRADHYSYARYGIPSVSLSRGEHLDYHMLTDEPQYIDYAALARVASFVRDVAVEVGNRAARPVVDKPAGDPKAPCKQ